MSTRTQLTKARRVAHGIDRDSLLSYHPRRSVPLALRYITQVAWRRERHAAGSGVPVHHSFCPYAHAAA